MTTRLESRHERETRAATASASRAPHRRECRQAPMIETEPLVDERAPRLDASAAGRPTHPLMTVGRLARSLGKAPAAARLLVDQFERLAIEADRALGWRDRIPPILASFIGFVIAPSVAASLYFAFIAADQFTVETRFAVRSLEIEVAPSAAGAVAGLGEGGSGGGAGGVSISSSSQSAYVVTSYIRSRAIIDDLAGKVRLREIFRRPEADFWARLGQNVPVEKLVDYWNSMVDTDVETVRHRHRASQGLPQGRRARAGQSGDDGERGSRQPHLRPRAARRDRHGREGRAQRVQGGPGGAGGPQQVPRRVRHDRPRTGTRRSARCSLR